MEFIWNTRELFVNPGSSFDPSHRGTLHSLSQNPAGGIPVQGGSGQPEAGRDGRFGNIGPLPKRRPSTMSSPPTVGRPQNSMAETRLQISELQFDTFSNPTTFLCWQIRSRTHVCQCSDFPSKAMLWIKDVEMVDSVEDLKSSQSIKGEDFPDYEMLDARIASCFE